MSTVWASQVAGYGQVHEGTGFTWCRPTKQCPWTSRCKPLKRCEKKNEPQHVHAMTRQLQGATTHTHPAQGKGQAPLPATNGPVNDVRPPLGYAVLPDVACGTWVGVAGCQTLVHAQRLLGRHNGLSDSGIRVHHSVL
jgi:hypothetical protein